MSGVNTSCVNSSVICVNSSVIPSMTNVIPSMSSINYFSELTTASTPDFAQSTP